MVAESMTRGQGRRFLDMGRRLERSFQILGLLRSTLVNTSAIEAPLLEALLEIADSSMTYRRRYMASLQLPPVLDLLLSDEDNPRSLAFQFVALSESIDRLPRARDQKDASAEQTLVAASLARLRLANVRLLVDPAASEHRADLGLFLAEAEGELPLLSDSLSRTYLTHLQAARQQPSNVE
jgi:uncharacterized alpha-E superfamily protein